MAVGGRTFPRCGLVLGNGQYGLQLKTGKTICKTFVGSLGLLLLQLRVFRLFGVLKIIKSNANNSHLNKCTTYATLLENYCVWKIFVKQLQLKYFFWLWFINFNVICPEALNKCCGGSKIYNSFLILMKGMAFLAGFNREIA